MLGMRLGPPTDDAETGGEGLAVAAIVDVLCVKHLEARLGHDCRRIPRLIRGKSGGPDPIEAPGVSKAPTPGVRVNVDFELANAGRELLVERRVSIFQA